MNLGVKEKKWSGYARLAGKYVRRRKNTNIFLWHAVKIKNAIVK